MKRKSDQRRLSARKWQAHVKAQERSGLNRAEYCRRHKLSYHALTYWHRKIHHSGQSPVLVQVPAILPSPEDLQTSPDTSGVSIRVSGGMSIELAEQFSPATLGAVLAILEGR